MSHRNGYQLIDRASYSSPIGCRFNTYLPSNTSYLFELQWRANQLLAQRRSPLVSWKYFYLLPIFSTNFSLSKKTP